MKAPVAVATDVVFGRGGRRDLKLDLYRPADGKESLLPAVVFIHGGGWHGGEKESYRDLAARVASHGYACASVDYRVSVDAPFPAALEDCKCAVRWLRARAAESRADPRRIAVWGHSAGGHLAAMVALTPGQFEGEGGSSHLPSRAQCALCCSAPFDLAALWQTLRPAVEQFLGAAAVDRAAACARASPISYVAASATPFLVCHGGEDDLVPVKQSDAFVAALRAAEAPVEFLRMAGIGHDLDQQSAEVFGRALTFLDTHLKPSPA
ncbi:MAG: alpha/beta hydrolase [Armatimonadota bacterium]|nr:MAG: alpha/beta hydrolase [Armatimonadota bacterium]